MEPMTNEEKKKFLWGYRDSLRRMARIESEIEELRAMKMSASAGGSGPGRKGWTDDLSSFAARLDELERDKEEELGKAMQAYERVIEAIESVEDEREQDVLFYKYIKGMSLWEISEKTSYSDRHVRRLHKKALSDLRIKDVLKCPEMS